MDISGYFKYRICGSGRVHLSQDASRGSKGFHTQGHTMGEVMNQ